MKPLLPVYPSIVLEDHDKHAEFCRGLGITTMHERSFKMMGKRHRLGHIVYWFLRLQGVPNIEAEKEVALYLEGEGY